MWKSSENMRRRYSTPSNRADARQYFLCRRAFLGACQCSIEMSAFLQDRNVLFFIEGYQYNSGRRHMCVGAGFAQTRFTSRSTTWLTCFESITSDLGLIAAMV